MTKINRFTTDVIEELKFYVYRLIDPRTGYTFYVGKGKGNRIFAHINDALKDYEGENYSGDKLEDDVSNKIKQIREIKEDGLEVIHLIHRYGLTEKEALECEAALIDCYPMLTNIVKGHNAERGLTSVECIQRNISAEEYEEEENIEYCIIKIREQTAKEQGIYEATRKSWKANLDRVKKIPLVFSSINGIVKEIFEIEKWYVTKENRVMFDGRPLKDEKRRKLYINKRLPEKYRKKGSANPIQYRDKKL